MLSKIYILLVIKTNIDNLMPPIHNKILISLSIFMIVIPLFSGCIEEDGQQNKTPEVSISYPSFNQYVAGIVKITGTAFDEDGEKQIQIIEIRINGSDWITAEGTVEWSYDWNTFSTKDGNTIIYARAFDGIDYSEIIEIEVQIQNPEISESDAHKWGVFIAAGNYPVDNESKLGNGGLNLAEDMVAYFIEEYGYSTSNLYILFDDGWIREDNGYGKRIETLQQRYHQYDSETTH